MITSLTKCIHVEIKKVPKKLTWSIIVFLIYFFSYGFTTRKCLWSSITAASTHPLKCKRGIWVNFYHVQNLNTNNYCCCQFQAHAECFTNVKLWVNTHKSLVREKNTFRISYTKHTFQHFQGIIWTKILIKYCIIQHHNWFKCRSIVHCNDIFVEKQNWKEWQ